MRNEWSRSAVDRILRDERYTGKLVSLKRTRTEVGNYNSAKPILKENWVVVPDAFEAIILQEIFDQAVEGLQKYARKRVASTPDENRIFVRKLKCAGCGLALDRETVNRLIRSIKVCAGNRIEVIGNFSDILADF